MTQGRQMTLGNLILTWTFLLIKTINGTRLASKISNYLHQNCPRTKFKKLLNQMSWNKKLRKKLRRYKYTELNNEKTISSRAIKRLTKKSILTRNHILSLR